jgi:colanic acid biosynthesis glycosyl transferase WcaI
MISPAGRWLLLTQYYPPEIGAPQIRLRAVARVLRQHGIQVSVLTAMPNYPVGKVFPGYTGRFHICEEIDNVPVTRTWIYAGTGRSALVRLANYLSFTCTALAATLTGPRPDMLLVESQPLSLGFIAVLMKWLRGVPYIYNVPDLQVDVAKQLGFMRNAGVLRLAEALENLFLRQSWKVSTVTHRFREHFQSRGVPPSQTTFLPNGADTEFLRPQPPSQALLDRWILRGKKVFVYVGTHAFYHGLDVLIEAATLLRKRSDIVFLMVGDGPERARMIRMCEDRSLANVVFGDSPYEEMDQLYSVAYASVATLRKIAVAKDMRLSKVFPSLSCAVPVIYSGIGEAAELLEAHKCGVAVEPEQPGLLANTVARLSDDPNLRDAMGSAGRALVEKEYSWSTIVERWLAEIGVSTRNSAQKEETAQLGVI